MADVKLGDVVRDGITGFSGVAISRVEYINGCVQFGVAPKAKDDGKMPDSVYIDHQRLQVIDHVQVEDPKRTGGVMRDAPAASYRG